MKTSIYFSLIGILIFLNPIKAIAAEDNKISPTIITNEAGDSSVGFNFNYNRKFYETADGDSVIGTRVRMPEVDVRQGAFINGKGAVSLNSDILSKDLVTFNGGYEWVRTYDNRAVLGIFESIGLNIAAKHETDQEFHQSNTSGGIFSTATYDGTDWQIALSIGADHIISDNDDARKKLIDDNNYWRAGGELNLGYKFEFGAQELILAWNYRYFHELDAPVEVRAGRLENYRLSNLKLTFLSTSSSDVFISYSTGVLPFDHTKDRVYKIGLDYKF